MAEPGCGKEGDRCLGCSTVCENCVDVCPNRANISVKVPGMEKAQVIHVDYMCNECGNCRSFCPYASAPYLDKFTLVLTHRGTAQTPLCVAAFRLCQNPFPLVNGLCLHRLAHILGNGLAQNGLRGGHGVAVKMENGSLLCHKMALGAMDASGRAGVQATGEQELGAMPLTTRDGP